MSELTHRCEVCGSDCTIYLSPRCHAGAPVFCALTGDVLTLECAKCRQVVVRLRVGEMVEEAKVSEPGKPSGEGPAEEATGDESEREDEGH